MPASLDLRKAWKHHKHGDLIVVLTWVNDSRALVLIAGMRKNAGWYIVDESSAWRWGIDHHDPDFKRLARQHVEAQSVIACDVLNLEPSRMNRTRVVAIITGWLPDLVRMPSSPEPEFKPGAFGEIVGKIDGKELNPQLLRIEDKGQSYG